MIVELEKSLIEVDHKKEVKTHFSIIGKSLGLPGSVQQIQGQHIGAMVVELVSTDIRKTQVSDLINLWKNNIEKPAGLEYITISSKRQGPPGKDIDIRIIPNNINNDKIVFKAKEISIEFLENNNSFSIKEWKELYRLSEETFVEETDSSKKKGAGAGLTDND